MFKNKLKLDLTTLQGTEQQNQQQNDGGAAPVDDVVGFHQEFMAKINQFSESWRQAAMNQKKF